MNLRPDQLEAQFWYAVKEWPFVIDVELEYGFPPYLMFALGSRETNLRNIKGDYSQRSGEASPRYHGFGVWQRDLQHGIPEGWMDDVRGQCVWSANLLRNNFTRCGDWAGACNRYNSGSCNTSATTGRDYGPDVLGRREWLANNMPDLVNLHPVFRARVLNACSVVGTTVYSGARSTQRQRELYEDFKAGRGNPANPPGTSWHEYGPGIPGGEFALAVDFAEPYPHGQPGLIFPIRGEPWHAQAVEIPESSRVAGAELRMPKVNNGVPSVEEMKDMVVQLVSGGEDWLYDSPGRIMYRITAGGVFNVLKGEKVGRYEVDAATLEEFKNVARNAGFTG